MLTNTTRYEARLTLSCGLLFFCLSACTEPEGEAAAPRTIVLLDAAVEVLGTSESLAEVLDLEIDADGTVWALNSVEPFFVGFDGSGTVVREHGSAGGGPEEFLLPAGFVSGGLMDSTWVLDGRRHAFVNISGPSETRSEIALPPEQIPPGSVVTGMSLLQPTVRTARLGSALIVPRTAASLRDGVYAFRVAMLQADFVRVTPDGAPPQTLIALGEALGDPAAGFDNSEGGFPLWYRLWDVCGTQGIRVYDRSSNELLAFGPDGSEQDRKTLPAPPFEEISPRQFANAIYGFRVAEVSGSVGGRVSADDSLRIVNEIVNGTQGTPRQLADYLPRYVDMHCTDEGTTWLRPLDVERGALQGSDEWLRVDSAGAVVPVRFPERFDPLLFTGSRVWGVQRDALDVPSLAWIDLTAGA